MKNIFLSPSNQTGNAYAYGNTNEAAECGKIAKFCEAALKRCGFNVKTEQWDTIENRSKHSDAWGADLHVPIHTNAFNHAVAGTRLFCYSLKDEGYNACKAVYKYLAPLTPGTSENIQARTDLYEVRVPIAKTVYIEVDFHDVPSVAKWLVENTEAIGEAICKGICEYYGVKYVEPKVEEPTETTVNVALTVLKKGSNGEQVKALQRLLQAMGYNLGSNPIDGIFGSLVDAAVCSYQKSNGLTADGIVGQQTWNKLLGVK